MKLFFLIILDITFLSNCKELLRGVFEISREGVKLPIKSIEDIINKYEYFKDELSGIGERQQFLLGLKKHNRYIENNNLINKSYDPYDIFFGSCGTNSSFESALAQLQGLYPSGTNLNLSKTAISNSIPPNKENFNDIQKELGVNSLPYNIGVFPVHKLFNKEFQFNLIFPENCPEIENLMIKRQKRRNIKDLMKEFNKKFKDKFQNKNNHFSYNDIFNICNSIILEYSNGINMNKYGDNYFINELIEYSRRFLYFDLIGSDEKDDEIGLITMSNTMKRIIGWMDKKIKNDINGEENSKNFDLPKLVMYSATENHLGAFEAFMHAVFKTPFRYPYYSSSIYLELIRKNKKNSEKAFKENQYFINYYFDDEYIFSMSYSLFKKKILNSIKPNHLIENFCKIKKENIINFINFEKIIFSCVGTLLLICVHFILFYKNNNNVKNIN